MNLSSAVLRRLRATLPRQATPAISPAQIIAAVGALRSAANAVRVPGGYADNDTLANIGAKALGMFANAVAHKQLADSGLDKSLDFANPSPSDMINSVLGGFNTGDKPDPGDLDNVFGPRDAYGRKQGDPDYGKAPDFGGVVPPSSGQPPATSEPDNGEATNGEEDQQSSEDDQEQTDYAPPGFGGTGTAFNPEGDDAPGRGPRLPGLGPGIASYDPEGGSDGNRGDGKSKRPLRRPGFAGLPVPDDGGTGNPLSRAGAVSWLDGLIGASAMREVFSGRSTLVGTANVRS